MSNLVEILVTAKDLTGPAMAEVNAKVNSASKGMAVFHKTALLAGAGFAAIGFEAVKMASRFDSEMTLLQTQAGVSKDKIGGLKQGVLDLAGKVAQSPDSLAEALFHVESNFESMGITSTKALALTETAAKGATVGHANLVDVTNALTAAVASGIPGVQNFDQAMGMLNATVGVGDMKMSDLASAFSTGMVATVKGYGLSITDVSAALAVFGDNNIRGTNAATQLRMAVQYLAKPVAGGAAQLQALGLQTDTLAKDMQKGGLKLALEDLVGHMQAAGIASDQQGQVITNAFGKKAGTGINILVDQLGRMESKYPALAAGAMGFQDAWTATTKTAAFQAKALQSSFDALMISIGEKLLPPLQSLLNLLSSHKAITMGATVATLGLLGAVVLVSAAMKTAAAATMLWSAATKGAAGVAAVFETVALKAMYMKDASIAAGGGLKGLGAAFGTLSTGAKLGVAVAAIGALVLVLDKLSNSGKHAPDVDRMATALGDLALKGKATGELSRTFGADLSGLGDDIAKLSGKKDALDHFNDVMNKIFTLGMGHSNGPRQAAEDIGAVDKGLASLVTSGHADLAAIALGNLQRAGTKIDPKYLDAYTHALADTQYQSDLTAQAQGKFGKQAQDVQAALDVQKAAADGLALSLQALDQINQDSYNSQTKFEDAISKGTAALKTNGATLDVHTDKGRANRDALAAIAAGTDDYTAKLVKQGATWDTVNGVYQRGYNSLVKSAIAMGDSRQQAEALANSLIHIPKEVKVGGNISDVEAKLKKLNGELKTATGSRTTKVKADIADAEKKLADYKWQLAQLGPKTVTLTTFFNSVYSGPNLGGLPKRATGGQIKGPGTGASDDVLMWGSNGEYVINAEQTKKHKGLLDAINGGLDGFAGGGLIGYAKGGKVTAARKAAQKATAAEQQARGDALSQLDVSGYGRVAGYSASPFEHSTSGAGSVDSLVSALNEWNGRIRAATRGATESKLLNALNNFGAGMLKNEKALERVNGQLDGARAKLTSLKDSFNQLRDSVASSVTSYGSIAKSGTGQPGGAASVINQLQTDTTTAKRFASDLAALKKKGLNAQSLTEIANAGISGGGLETAERLLGSSKSDVKTINALEKQLLAAGNAAGTTTASSMYGAGISQAQGLVNGLAKQQSHLNAIMEKAADAMAAQLKRSLSGKASGGIVGAAASGGNRWGRTLVGEYAPELVDLPIGSRVHSGPDTARMLSGEGGRMAPILVQVVMDSRVVAEQLVEPTRNLVQRKAGGDVQKFYGGRL